MFDPVTIVRSPLYQVSVPYPVAYPLESRDPDQTAESPRRGKLFQTTARPSLVR